MILESSDTCVFPGDLLGLVKDYTAAGQVVECWLPERQGIRIVPSCKGNPGGSRRDSSRETRSGNFHVRVKSS